MRGDHATDELNATMIGRRLEEFAKKAFRRPPVNRELSQSIAL